MATHAHAIPEILVDPKEGVPYQPWAKALRDYRTSLHEIDDPGGFCLPLGTIQGTITKVEMTNPHAWIYINVKEPDGRLTNYGVQTSGPLSLIRRGGDRKTLATGTIITVEGWSARDGSNTLNGRTIITADGKRIIGDVAQP